MNIIIDRAKRRLCNDLSVENVVLDCVCLSHDNVHTPLPIVMKFGTNVPGTKAE